MEGQHEDINYSSPASSPPLVDSPPQMPFNPRTDSTSTLVSGEVPAVIPPADPQRQRTLVLCFDGTGDQFDSDNSNIVEFFSMLKKDDSDKQMCYYQAGIGTYTSPQLVTPFMSKISKSLDEAIAWNLGAHVMDGYEFLMQNYKAGDKICIFGFSRGAYTARALAGMLYKVGLLPACNHQQVPFAYKMFTRTDETGWKQSSSFKRAFSVDVDIEFVGVWDTVISVGLIPRRLPFTTSNTSIRIFRHAVALDERRAKFKANHWNQPTAKDIAISQAGDKPKKKKKDTDPHAPKKLKHMERQYTQFTDSAIKETDVEEVWFAGCHCDVGGGSVLNETPHSLARIPLRWMIRECFKTNTGIMFYSEGLEKVGLDPATLYPFVLPRPAPLPATNCIIQDIPKNQAAQLTASENNLLNFADHDAHVERKITEEEHDLLDIMSPIYDQLSLAPGWWILEVFPMKQRMIKDDHEDANDNSWTAYLNKKVGLWNLGYGRVIPRQKKGVVKVHHTVQMRMEAKHKDDTKYIPQASFERAIKYNKLVWV